MRIDGNVPATSILVVRQCDAGLMVDGRTSTAVMPHPSLQALPQQLTCTHLDLYLPPASMRQSAASRLSCKLAGVWPISDDVPSRVACCGSALLQLTGPSVLVAGLQAWRSSELCAICTAMWLAAAVSAAAPLLPLLPLLLLCTPLLLALIPSLPACYSGSDIYTMRAWLLYQSGSACAKPAS